jgi:hypothetical protein
MVEGRAGERSGTPCTASRLPCTASRLPCTASRLPCTAPRLPCPHPRSTWVILGSVFGHRITQVQLGVAALVRMWSARSPAYLRIVGSVTGLPPAPSIVRQITAHTTPMQRTHRESHRSNPLAAAQYRCPHRLPPPPPHKKASTRSPPPGPPLSQPAPAEPVFASQPRLRAIYAPLTRPAQRPVADWPIGLPCLRLGGTRRDGNSGNA